MKRYFVCPECLALNSLLVVREVIHEYQYSPDKLDFDGTYYDEPKLVSEEISDQKWIYCSECRMDIDTSEYLTPEELLAKYLIEVDDEGKITHIGEELTDIFIIGENFFNALARLKGGN